MSEKKQSAKKSGSVSSQSEFYSDLSIKNMWYAQIVRAPAKSGSITSITTPDLPDEYYFFTARNVPGKNIIDTPSGKIPLFCEGSISYLGEPVGIITGPDEKQVNEYARDVVITVDDTPLESYLEETDKSNELFSAVMAKRILKDGPDVEKLDELFESAAVVSQNCWINNIQTPDYGEPDGAICSYENGQLTVYAPTQWIANLRDILMQSMGLESASIIIKKTKSKNLWTNGIWYNSVITAQVAIASFLTGHAVKLMFTRDEQEQFMTCMHDVTITHKTALDKDGTLLAMQIDIDVDAGSYNPFAQEIIDRLVIASTGCYAPKNISVMATAYRSTKPPSSFNFHTVDASAFFALENQMNELCRKSQLSPLEIRKKNIRIEKNHPVSHFMFPLDKTHETLDALALSSDFNRKYAAYHLNEMQRHDGLEKTQQTPLRGIGFSCAFEGSGYFGSELYSTDQELSVTKEKDGTITIYSPPVSESIRTIWTELASGSLGIARNAVNIDTHAADAKEPQLPENAYSNISIMTRLLQKCCDVIKKQDAKTALPFTAKRKSSPTERKAWDNTTFSGKPFHSASFAAATVELELDPCTFSAFIRQIHVVINGGRLLNYKAAERTIKLTLQKMLASLVKNESLSSAQTTISFIKSDEPPVQLGNLIYRIIPAAYTQALTQALGYSITSLPLKTNSLFLKLLEQRIKEQAERAKEEAQKETNQEETQEGGNE
ncbi:MAG: xanthine dehydrogenase family protein [Treponema sp.]|nr:xanthine dehydrogenase family protein [Treponema sp.]